MLALAPAVLGWLIGPDVLCDHCSIDPGFDVDLCDLMSVCDLMMVAIRMGIETVRKAPSEQRLMLTGDCRLAPHWKTDWPVELPSQTAA